MILTDETSPRPTLHPELRQSSQSAETESRRSATMVIEKTPVMWMHSYLSKCEPCYWHQRGVSRLERSRMALIIAHGQKTA